MINSRTVISVEGLAKRYRLGATSGTLRDRIAAAGRMLLRRSEGEPSRSRPDFWALRNVSFDVAEGEVLGVIGANGAGKSTLLKILSQITEPTRGEVRLRGRVAALLEVGTGFHSELSGRENVFMNGAILGMTQTEIKRKFDAIVAFAGVEEFVDTPVKRYSSGMLVRLGFAVAAHLEPEVLIIDEVLAVGDAEFQRRCLAKMGEVSRSGRTVLFVSHNLAAVDAMCDRSILLVSGEVRADGPTSAVIETYNRRLSSTSHDSDLTNHPSRVVAVDPVLTGFNVIDSGGSTSGSVSVGRPVTFRVTIKARTRLVRVIVGLHFVSSIGQRVMTLHSGYQGREVISLQGEAEFRCLCPMLQLAPGRYHIVVSVLAGGDQIDRIEPAATIDVLPADFYRTGRVPPTRDGVFWAPAEWECSTAAIDVADTRPVGA